MNQSIKEKIIREVSAVGNGAHVFAPKEWIGEKIILIRKPKKPIKDNIIDSLKMNLDSIEGVYLTGSYARGEEEKDSDIDVFVIANKKVSIENDENIQLISIKKERISEAIKLNPVLIYSLIHEAKTIINEDLLKELKDKYKPKITDFSEYIKETKRISSLNRDMLDEEIDPYDLKGHAYSIILRLRGVYLIKSLLKNRKYSNSEFKKLILKNSRIDYESIYLAYRSVKNNTDEKIKLKKDELISLLNTLDKEIKNLESYEKKKET